MKKIVALFLVVMAAYAYVTSPAVDHFPPQQEQVFTIDETGLQMDQPDFHIITMLHEDFSKVGEVRGENNSFAYASPEERLLPTSEANKGPPLWLNGMHRTSLTL